MRNTSDRKVLHIDRVNPSPLWNYKQEDDGVLLLSIYKGGQTFEVTGQTITLGIKNSKGQLIEHKTGITISGSNVDIVLSNSIFAVKGKLECDLILKDSAGQMSTATFYLMVGQKVLGENNILSTNIVPTIDKIANDFETRGNKLIDDVTKDYCTLQKVIIDENASADLQNQINEVNTSLETNALLYYGKGLNDDVGLQSILNYARDNKKSEVKIIGDCVINKTVLYHSNIKISSVNGTISLAEGLTQQVKSIFSPAAEGVHDVIFDGVILNQKCDIYMNNGNSPCLSINRCKNITIKNCVFKNIQTMAVWFDDTKGITENIKILDNTIENSWAGGISVFGYCKGLTIRGNYIKNTKDDAIALQPSSSGNYRHMYQNETIIEGNIIEDCDNKDTARATARGIICWAGVNVTIRGNIINNTYSHSIYVFDGEEDLVEDIPEQAVDKELNVIIDGNVCVNAGSNNTSGNITPANGIDIRVYVNSRIRNIIISNNIITGSICNGIYINSDNVLTMNNIIRNVKQSGIFLQNTQNSSIGSNLIEKNILGDINMVGIYLNGLCVDNNIFNNRVFGLECVTGLVLQSSAEYNVIRSNNFKGCKSNTIINNGSNNELYENKTIKGLPLSKIHTLSASGTTFGITGISTIPNQPVLIQALNDSARALLSGGFRVTTQTDLVEFRTQLMSVGGEQILIRCL